MILLVLRATPSLRQRLIRIRVPAGDLVVPLTLVLASCRRISKATAVAGLSSLINKIHHRLARFIAALARRLLDCLQRGLENAVEAGLLIGALTVALFVLMIL